MRITKHLASSEFGAVKACDLSEWLWMTWSRSSFHCTALQQIIHTAAQGKRLCRWGRLSWDLVHQDSGWENAATFSLGTSVTISGGWVVVQNHKNSELALHFLSTKCHCHAILNSIWKLKEQQPLPILFSRSCLTICTCLSWQIPVRKYIFICPLKLSFDDSPSSAGALWYARCVNKLVPIKHICAQDDDRSMGMLTKK